MGCVFCCIICDIGSVVGDVGSAVGDVVSFVANNPIIDAAAAVVAPELLPAVEGLSAADAADVAATAADAGLTSTVGDLAATTGANLGADSGLIGGANLGANVGNFGFTAAPGAITDAGLASSGGVGGMFDATTGLLSNPIVSKALTNAAIGGVKSGLTGGCIFTGALTGGASGLVGGTIGNLTGSNLAGNIAGALSGAGLSMLTGAPTTTTKGKSNASQLNTTALNTLNTGAGSTSSSALPGLLTATSLNSTDPTANSNNTQLEQLSQIYPQLAQANPGVINSLLFDPAQAYSGKSFTNNPAEEYAAEGGVIHKKCGGVIEHPNFLANLIANHAKANSDALMHAGVKMMQPGGALPTFEDGGKTHTPEFITGTTGHYVKGRGDGQSDDIPAMLADGEYVFDADTVAALGNGSSDAGAKVLDKLRMNLRKHKRSASADKIPPKAKSPLEYLKG